MKEKKTKGRKSFLARMLKLNNNGSSMVGALVAIAFVGILATVAMSTTLTNYRLKTMNYEAKKTFYSAESALEEIKAGFGTRCYEELESAYIDTITALVKYDATNKKYNDVDNNAANNNVRRIYLANVAGILESVNKERTKNGEDEFTGWDTYFTSFLKHPDNAKVSKIGNVTQDISKVIFNDVVVEYKSSKAEYYSTVTVDIEIEYPDIEFKFIKPTDYITTYLDYALIGMKGIDFAENITASVSGGAYAGNVAGNGGIGILNGAKVSILPNDISKTIIISQKDIDVKGQLNVSEDTRLWTNNINVTGSVSNPEDGKLTYADGTGSFTYLKDDLNMLGAGSKATLGKHFYGYSFANNYLGTSSAIVINGTDTKLDASSVASLLIAGRAYVKYDDNGYMTADSIGLKGNQEIYLVPSEYMKSTNPEAITDIKGVDENALKDFYAYSLLKEGTAAQWTCIDSDGARYYYLNFKDTNSQIKYVNSIFTGKIDGVTVNDVNKDIPKLKKTLQKSLEKYILGDSLSVGGTKVLTSGNLYQVSSSALAGNAAGVAITNAQKDLYTKVCNDLSNRFTILSQFLYDMGEDGSFTTKACAADVTNGEIVKIVERDISVDVNADANATVTHDYIVDSTTTVYDRIADTVKLQKIKDNLDTEPFKIDAVPYALSDSAMAYAVVVVGNTNYMVPTSYTCGVILAYDADVTVSSDFEGLIITNGRIIVKNNAAIKANHRLAEKVIKGCSSLSQYLLAFVDNGNNNSANPSNITIDELLSFNNWRKNNAN